MHASAIILALFAAAAAAAPGAPSPAKQPSQPQPQPPNQPSGSSSPAPSGAAPSCNFLTCAVALGPAGLKCIEFAFGGSGKDCLHEVLQDIEHMPSSCADCLNAIFD